MQSAIRESSSAYKAKPSEKSSITSVISDEAQVALLEAEEEVEEAEEEEDLRGMKTDQWKRLGPPNMCQRFPLVLTLMSDMM